MGSPIEFWLRQRHVYLLSAVHIFYLCGNRTIHKGHPDDPQHLGISGHPDIGINNVSLLPNVLARFPALLSALSYMALPYHLIDIYQRSALAESWAFTFIPLICFFTVKIRRKALPHLVGLSLSYAGLILTHLPTAFLFTFFFTLVQNRFSNNPRSG